MSSTITGTSGTQWTNTTGKVYYQLVCSLVNTCGYCLPLHMQIAKFWPTPFHGLCRCQSIPIYPNQTAHPFADFEEIYNELPEHERKRVIGSTIGKLLDHGSIGWDDVRSKNRIRTLREIIRRKRLSVGDLTEAGVGKKKAIRLVDDAASPVRRFVNQATAKLAEILTAQRVSPETILKLTGVVIRRGSAAALIVVEEEKATPPQNQPRGRKGGFPWLVLPWDDNEAITPEQARAILVAAIGEEKTQEVEPLPGTVKELNVVLKHFGASIDATAIRAIMEKLGVKS